MKQNNLSKRRVLQELQETISEQQNIIELFKAIIIQKQEQLTQLVALAENVQHLNGYMQKQLEYCNEFFNKIIVTYSWYALDNFTPPIETALLVGNSDMTEFAVTTYDEKLKRFTNSDGGAEVGFEVVYWRHMEAPQKLISFVHEFSVAVNALQQQYNNDPKIPPQQNTNLSSAGAEKENSDGKNSATNNGPRKKITFGTKKRPPRERRRESDYDQTEQSQNSYISSTASMDKALELYKQYQIKIGKEDNIQNNEQLLDVFNKFCIFSQGKPYCELNDRGRKEISLTLNRLLNSH